MFNMSYVTVYMTDDVLTNFKVTDKSNINKLLCTKRRESWRENHWHKRRSFNEESGAYWKGEITRGQASKSINQSINQSIKH